MSEFKKETEIIKLFELWSEDKKSYTKYDVFIAGYKLGQEQINCELSALLEQRNEMFQMLEVVHYTLENEGFTETRNNINQLIKKVKDYE
jgi:hypothetical protein